MELLRITCIFFSIIIIQSIRISWALDTEKCLTGGKTIRDSNAGILTSAPSWSSERSCLWILPVPANKYMKIKFNKFSLKEQQLCPSSFVDITVNKTITTRYCGRELPPSFTVAGPQSLIIYHSIGRVNEEPGIEIQYELVNQMNECGTGQFSCRNKKCVEMNVICDGKDDCYDGSDEENCGHTTKSPTECGAPAINPDTLAERIVGGEEAIPGSWPWQISIQKKDTLPSGHVCGGSLINNFWILTAGHCFEKRNGSVVRILLGDHNTFKYEGNEITRYVEKVYVHPAYDPEPKNDIALLKLNAPVQYNNRISPICLPSNDDVLGGSAIVTGWGDTMTHGESDVLRQAVIPFINSTKCNELYFDTVSPNTLCTLQPGGGRSPCNGDSGGPLVQKKDNRWTLRGIVSWGHRICGTERGPAVYTDVQKYLTWIKNIVDKE